MNEELQNFIVKITTEGFADLRTTLEKTNKLLDDATKNFDKTKKSGDSFFGALVKWTGLVGGLTLAFQTLKNTIKGVFDTAYDVVDLYRQEQLLGVEARVLEQYGVVAQRNRGSQADAYAFFGDVNELMGRFRSGKINQDDMYKFSKLGIGFQYNANQSLSQNRDRYLQELHNAVSKINLNNADQISIMKDLIRPASMQTLFMANDEQFRKQMAWGDKWRVLSKDENDLQSAQDLVTVETEWKQTLTDFKLQLMPILTEVLNALKPVIPVIREKITQMGEWVDKHAEDLAKWVENGVNWLIKDLPDWLSKIWDGIKAFLGALQPVVEWFAKRGSLSAVWDTAKAMWADIARKPDADEKWQKLYDRYLKEGATEGGYFGDYLRMIHKIPAMTSTSSKTNITNNAPNVIIKGDSYFPKDTRIDTNHPTGAMLARFATSVKN